MKYILQQSSNFKKGVKKAKKQGRDITLLENIVRKLANGETLPARFVDHALKGNRKNERCCHITPDWILIYKIIKDRLILQLLEIGSHASILDM